MIQSVVVMASRIRFGAPDSLNPAVEGGWKTGLHPRQENGPGWRFAAAGPGRVRPRGACGCGSRTPRGRVRRRIGYGLGLRTASSRTDSGRAGGPSARSRIAASAAHRSTASPSSRSGRSCRAGCSGGRSAPERARSSSALCASHRWRCRSRRKRRFGWGWGCRRAVAARRTVARATSTRCGSPRARSERPPSPFTLRGRDPHSARGVGHRGVGSTHPGRGASPLCQGPSTPGICLVAPGCAPGQVCSG